MPVVRFDVIEVSADVERKIAGGKHTVSSDDVLEACAAGPTFKWTVGDRGQPKLLCRGTTHSGRVIDFVLYPIDGAPGEWRLATAYVHE